MADDRERYARRLRLVFQPRMVEAYDDVDLALGSPIDTVAAGAGGITAEQFEGTVNRVSEEGFWSGRVDVHDRLASPPGPMLDVVAQSLVAAGAGVPVLHSSLAALADAAEGLIAQTATAQRDMKGRRAARERLMGELAAAKDALGIFAELPPPDAPDVVARDALAAALAHERDSKQAALEGRDRGRATARRAPHTDGPSHHDLRF